MDLNDTPELAEYRTRVREWLAEPENARPGDDRWPQPRAARAGRQCLDGVGVQDVVDLGKSRDAAHAVRLLHSQIEQRDVGWAVRGYHVHRKREAWKRIARFDRRCRTGDEMVGLVEGLILKMADWSQKMVTRTGLR